ncbi:DUF3945 domain-containing protein (plasmid) [Adhaeribacter swui]|uniref:DUF3945 domain-containing protein n=1 Tax=Adhaeribacter swui TaxID=2086471 RepID=A0A7G7G2H6_9BACT|nr:DUF4099 domain-containing protein [Adhaeribacter swui]QNF31360.1 DUF3945 domain-containing protein [Adhaeribacter swui]
MKFDIKDLPYSQFEQLGMSKRDVIKMNPQDLASMLNGGRTNLIPLTIALGNGINPIEAEVKLSLVRNPDNTVSLNVHPIQNQPKNTIGAIPAQWEQLLKGEIIIKEAKTFNGSVEPHLYQLDKQTNELLSARVNSIQVPNFIQGIAISSEQKEQLKQGQAIELEGKSAKEGFVIRLDLNEARGYKLLTREQSMEQAPGIKPNLPLEEFSIKETPRTTIKM